MTRASRRPRRRGQPAARVERNGASILPCHTCRSAPEASETIDLDEEEEEEEEEEVSEWVEVTCIVDAYQYRDGEKQFLVKFVDGTMLWKTEATMRAELPSMLDAFLSKHDFSGDRVVVG